MRERIQWDRALRQASSLFQRQAGGIDFGDAAVKLKKQLATDKWKTLTNLMKAVEKSLQRAGFQIKDSDLDWDPRGYFLSASVEFEVPRESDPLERYEVGDRVDAVLGYGWQVSGRGPRWKIEYEM